MTKIAAKVFLVVVCCLFVATGASHAKKDGSKFFLPGDLTLEQAQTAIAAAVAHAEKQNALMDIAVVDAGGNLKAFVRMDGAFLASIDIAIRKAKTARALNMSTLELSTLAQPGGELFGIEVVDGGTMIFGGGELIHNKEGVIIGAIGVSGGSVVEDVAAAKAGAAAVK